MNRIDKTIGYADYSWNPVTGCLGPGGTPDKPNRCPYCYAHRLANGRLKSRYLAQRELVSLAHDTIGDLNDPFAPTWWTQRSWDPFEVQKPSHIFVSDMGDLFHPSIPSDWIRLVMSVVRDCPQHTFLFLTKGGVGRYNEFSPWPDNCWLGTTVTNQQDWDERWRTLKEIQCKLRWVSLEPLLDFVSFRMPSGSGTVPDWLVLGALTGRSPQQPEPEAIDAVMIFADFTNTPLFMKDNLSCEALGIERRQEVPG